MNYPKIVFRKMSLEENIEEIKWMFFDEGFVHDLTIEVFPNLTIYNINSPKEIVYEEIKKNVTELYNKKINEIDDKVKICNNIWTKYNDDYFNILTNYFETNFPNELKIIDAAVGILPVCPRDLNRFAFSVSIEVPDEVLINLCAHETLHFIWFEKWKKIHPETPIIEFESPYICWEYSEMVTDPILNNEPFTSFYKFNEKSYNHFYDLYDGEILVMDKLRNIYSENIPINEKIDKGYEYIKTILCKNK